MNSSKALQIIYEVTSKKIGPLEARRFVSSTLYNLIADFQDSGQEITAESIEKALIEEAQFCQECAKKDAA